MTDAIGPLFDRRRALTLGATACGAAWWSSKPGPALAAEPARGADEPFGYCFNTSTIRGQNLPLVKEIELIAAAGYTALEPWINEIEKYKQDGGSLPDLARRLKDLGLTIESAIGFPEWIVDDDARRAKGLEQAKREMDLVARLGGRRLAAPPAGATNQEGLNLARAAERYRALCEIGDQLGVAPQVELWGFSKSLRRLGEVLYVAAESGHPRACVLLDVYHMYKGGSDPAGLKLLGGAAMHVLHMNDYPANPPRDKIADADRVFPGEGVAPLGAILRTLRDVGFRGHLSLELFHRDLWRQDPLTVAKTGLLRMRDAVRKALA